MPLPSAVQASLGVPPQDRYDGSADEYLSDEDELGEHDLHTLTPDYDIQRHLSANAQHRYPDPQYSHPDPRHLRRSADDPNRPSYRYKAQPRAWNAGHHPSLKHEAPRAKSIYTGNLLLYDDEFAPPFHNARAYQSQQRRRPLIDFIKNEWRHIDKSHSSDSSPTQSTFVSPFCLHILAAPNFQRTILVLLALLFLIWGNWKTWAGQRLNEDYMLKTTLRDKLKSNEGWFGENMRPQFLDMIQVKALDNSLIPQKGEKKRLIVIGDVHGCHEERTKTLTCFST